MGDWLGSSTLRHLVQRTVRCQLPPVMERGPPRFPEVWVVRLPSPEAVVRTATAREGRAVEPYWAALAGEPPLCPALPLSSASPVCRSAFPFSALFTRPRHPYRLFPCLPLSHWGWACLGV